MRNKPVFVLFISLLFFSACVEKEKTVSLKLDLQNTGETISPYVYGQFIEHLGNCIYNGIWSEMLDDRKFYFPVLDNYNPYSTSSDPFWNTGDYKYLAASPWEVIGPTGRVIMQTKDPFVGEHSPEFTCTKAQMTGIKQHEIGLINARKYIGRIVLKGDSGVLPVIIRISYGDSLQEVAIIDRISKDYSAWPFEFIAIEDTDLASIEIFSKGSGKFTIGTISLMPADNVDGWRADVLELLKELNAPVYRWPGGNFVSGYNWKDGIGEQDKRPPRKNPAWKGVEPNDVGIHEYMNLMKIINSEAFIAVNTGSGTPEETAEEIAYCRSDNSSAMGKWRSENGHPEPFDVKFWAVGNEMYGNWQIGHMPLEEYVKKHNRTAEAIWKVDPEAQLIGVGAIGEWSKTMLKVCSDHMDLISEHHYSREIDTSLADHVNQIARAVKGIADNHRTYRKEIPELEGKDIRIALDEWNYWYGDYIYGELGVRYHMKDALGIAKGLHEIFRNSDIYFMANYAQTVNVIGCIKTTDTKAGFAATGQVLKLYRNHFGSIPLKIDVMDENLDIAAALNEGASALTIALVNSSLESKTILIEPGNSSFSPEVKQWLIHNPDPEAYNIPGEKEEVGIQFSTIGLKRNRISVPGLSVMMLELNLQK